MQFPKVLKSHLERRYDLIISTEIENLCTLSPVENTLMFSFAFFFSVG